VIAPPFRFPGPDSAWELTRRGSTGASRGRRDGLQLRSHGESRGLRQDRECPDLPAGTEQRFYFAAENSGSGRRCASRRRWKPLARTRSAASMPSPSRPNPLPVAAARPGKRARAHACLVRRLRSVPAPADRSRVVIEFGGSGGALPVPWRNRSSRLSWRAPRAT